MTQIASTLAKKLRRPLNPAQLRALTGAGPAPSSTRFATHLAVSSSPSSFSSAFANSASQSTRGLSTFRFNDYSRLAKPAAEAPQFSNVVGQLSGPERTVSSGRAETQRASEAEPAESESAESAESESAESAESAKSAESESAESGSSSSKKSGGSRKTKAGLITAAVAAVGMISNAVGSDDGTKLLKAQFPDLTDVQIKDIQLCCKAAEALAGLLPAGRLATLVPLLQAAAHALRDGKQDVALYNLGQAALQLTAMGDFLTRSGVLGQHLVDAVHTVADLGKNLADARHSAVKDADGAETARPDTASAAGSLIGSVHHNAGDVANHKGLKWTGAAAKLVGFNLNSYAFKKAQPASPVPAPASVGPQASGSPTP